MKLKNTLAFYLTACMGGLMVFYIIYIRFIRENLPRDLPVETFQNKHYLILGVYLLLLIVWFCVFIYSLIIILEKKFDIYLYKKQNKFLSYLMLFYDRCMENFYILIFERMDFMENIYRKGIIPFLVFLAKQVNTRRRVYLVVTCVFILPRVIILAALFYDVIFLHRFYYICFWAPILILPLFERLILFLINYWIKSSEPHIANMLMFHYPVFGVSFNVNQFFEDKIAREIFNACFDPYYKISGIFPMKYPEFELRLNRDWHEKCSVQDPFYDASGSLKKLQNFLQTKHLPIWTLGEFYNSFRIHLLNSIYFGVLQAFFYVLIWSYLVFYIF